MMISDGYVGKRASATAKAAWAPQEGANFKLIVMIIVLFLHFPFWFSHYTYLYYLVQY